MPLSQQNIGFPLLLSVVVFFRSILGSESWRWDDADHSKNFVRLFSDRFLHSKIVQITSSHKTSHSSSNTSVIYCGFENVSPSFYSCKIANLENSNSYNIFYRWSIHTLILIYCPDFFSICAFHIEPTKALELNFLRPLSSHRLLLERNLLMVMGRHVFNVLMSRSEFIKQKRGWLLSFPLIWNA